LASPSDIPKRYYSFKKYNSKHRWLTYWHQIDEVLALKPTSVLEIGVGSGLVSSYLRAVGIKVTTLDINESLEPDHVGSLLNLDRIFEPNSFDAVLCARVLHHLPFDQLERAIEQIAYVASDNAVITMPVEDFRIYFMVRYTSSQIRTISLPLPLFIKRLVVRVLSTGKEGTKFVSGLWKINSASHCSMGAVTQKLEKLFVIKKAYAVPEDAAHHVFVLAKSE
jgi:ubiquinone/menaquinone biosynthesis C-methylase UbiE